MSPRQIQQEDARLEQAAEAARNAVQQVLSHAADRRQSRRAWMGAPASSFSRGWGAPASQV